MIQLHDYCKWFVKIQELRLSPNLQSNTHYRTRLSFALLTWNVPWLWDININENFWFTVQHVKSLKVIIPFYHQKAKEMEKSTNTFLSVREVRSQGKFFQNLGRQTGVPRESQPGAASFTSTSVTVKKLETITDDLLGTVRTPLRVRNSRETQSSGDPIIYNFYLLNVYQVLKANTGGKIPLCFQ